MPIRIYFDLDSLLLIFCIGAMVPVVTTSVYQIPRGRGRRTGSDNTAAF